MAHITTDSANNRYATDEYDFDDDVPVTLSDYGVLVILAGATVVRLEDDVLLIGVAT